MNKFLIVLLAVCLVSVHAFVKRDAPAQPEPNKNVADDLANQFTDLTNKAKTGLSELFDSEKMKKNFNDMVDGAKNFVESFKSTTAAPK